MSQPQKKTSTTNAPFTVRLENRNLIAVWTLADWQLNALIDHLNEQRTRLLAKQIKEGKPQ